MICGVIIIHRLVRALYHKSESTNPKALKKDNWKTRKSNFIILGYNNGGYHMHVLYNGRDQEFNYDWLYLLQKKKVTNIHISPYNFTHELNSFLSIVDMLINTLRILVLSHMVSKGPTRFSFGKLFGPVYWQMGGVVPQTRKNIDNGRMWRYIRNSF